MPKTNGRISAIISGPSTTASFSGKAPGATTRAYMIVELALTPSTFAIGAPPSAIQVAAVQPGGIATGIDPGVIRAATVGRHSPRLLKHPPQFHGEQFWPAFTRMAAHDGFCVGSFPVCEASLISRFAVEEIPHRRTQCSITSRMPRSSLL